MNFTVDAPFASIPSQRDEKPDLDENELDDTVSGDPEAPYGRTPTGRIRKRPVGQKGARSQGKPGASNEKLARQAAKTLVQLHGIVAVPVMLIGLQQTASALTDEDRNEQFEEQAYSALLVDPALCRAILSTGGSSAKLALVVAYFMFGAGVAMTAVPEFRELRAERASRRLNAD